MIACDAMRDRMPDVANGTGAWSEAEAAHLATCTECAQERRVVKAGVALHRDHLVATDRIAQTVVSRLRTETVAAREIRRLPWRGTVIGLLAAAASVLIVVYAPRSGASRGMERADTAIAALLPDLQRLDDSQLATVLRSIEPAAADIPPIEAPHLDDLTNVQLERLLHAMGGER